MEELVSSPTPSENLHFGDTSSVIANRKHLGGPTGRRNNSTSTMMVGDTLSRPNNELTIMGVAEKLSGYIKDSAVLENGKRGEKSKEETPTKKLRAIKISSPVPASENHPPELHASEKSQEQVEVFEIPSVEQISRYLRQIFKTAQCSVDCTIVCLIYIERLMNTSGLRLTVRNWRSLIAIGMLLASKVHDDLSMVNADFAMFLPFSVDQINQWERQFLAGIRYDVRVSAAQYTKYYFDLREKTIRELGGDLVTDDVGALDVQHAQRLEVLSSKVQRRMDEMRSQGEKGKLRRAVSDQYCPASQDVELPDAPYLGHSHRGNFVVD